MAVSVLVVSRRFLLDQRQQFFLVQDLPLADEIENAFDQIDAVTSVAVGEFRRCYDLPISYAESYDALLSRADSLVIATAWPEFRNVRQLTQKPVVDCRYML